MASRERLLELSAKALAPAVRAASRRGILPARGRTCVSGLAAPVLVHTDAFGVPHVRAETDADAFFAEGWCHVRDRFFQMDMLRRVLRGRLAETVGERAIGAHPMPPFGMQRTTTDADRLLRAFDLVGAARGTLNASSAGNRRLLDAYVRGVNAALVRLRRHRPIEHRFLRLPIVPWSPIDSIVIAKGMALGLSFKWRTSPVFGAIADHLSDRKALLDSILPRAPGPGDEAVFRSVRTGIEEALAFLPTSTPIAGSNAFLVGAGRSRSGSPLLASDPHLELSLPSIWYLASVQGRRFGAVGCSLAGLPGIVIGRTRGLAWGLTNGMIDDADLWEEELDLAGDRYRLDGQWRRLAVGTQEIRRRGRAPELFRLRRTHRGPLLTDAFPAYGGTPLSLRFSFQEPTADLDAFLALGRAVDGEGLEEVAAGMGAPVQNLLWADVRGRAGYSMMGRVPKRPETGHSHALSLDGRTTGTDWTGWIDRARLPSLELGSGDTLVSANDPHLAEADAPYLSHLYEPPYRALRLRELLEGRSDLAIDDLVAMQMDTKNLVVDWFRDRVLLPHAEAVRRTKPTLGHAIDRLLAWNGHETRDAVGAALWNLTYHHLLRRTFGGALGGELLQAWLGCVNLMEAPLRRAFDDDDSPWAPPAARGALLQRALDDAVGDLERRGLGTDAPWGDVHVLTLKHPLSAVPVLGSIFNASPVPAAGGTFTPCSGQYSHARPARVTSGPSYRHVVDLSDPETKSRMVTFGGQSGHVGSRHYDDLTPLWLEGKGLPMRLEELPRTKDIFLLHP